ncbi:MAG: peptidoglycan bridge formation glycyltransferase FemA/FemB family protein [Chloroflexota bacterium]
MRIVDDWNGALTAEVWDRLVASDPDGHLLQTWAWGDLKAAFGWRPVRLAVERDGALVAGAQVLYRRLGPLTLGYIPRGPALASGDPADLEPLWSAVHGVSRRLLAIALKVEPEWRDEDTAAHARLRAAGMHPSTETIQPRRTITVDLEGDEETILARMKPKWRYNVRLAGRKGVMVCEGGAEGLDTYYRLMESTGARDGFAIHNLDYYRRGLELFGAAGRARLFMAYADDVPLAGLIALRFGRTAVYMYGASSDERRELMPNHALQWRAMQWAKEGSCARYDLWGITDRDEDPDTAPLSGVERFKAGFGGEVVRYVGAYDYVYHPLLYRGMQALWARRRHAALGG